MLNRQDATDWLEALFRPGEIFEVRVKAEGERGAKQIWLPHSQIKPFVQTHIPIHESNHRNIWVGVCPRDKKGSSAAAPGRVLWCDMDNIDVDTALAAAEAAELPDPSMVVHSGHGVHFYWLLDKAYSPEDLRPHSKAVHEALPADNTHDPTRVMRVPGTINPKNGESTPCYIVRNTGEVHLLSDFPKVKDKLPMAGTQQSATPLTDHDRELFLANWIDGQKHYMVLGVAGYLRKELNYSYEEALNTISSIHREAGYEVDHRLVQDVKDTYALPWAKVSGSSQLYDLGIIPETKKPLRINMFGTKPKKPKITIIDPTKDIEPQEFWIPGLVGPGLITLWAAPPKTGKSFAIMQMAHALATGSDFYDMPTNGMHNVLYFQGELSQNMVMDRARSLFGPAMVRDPRRLAMTDKPDEVLSLVDNPETLMDIAGNYDVVIVDPISAFNTNDENSSTSVRNTVAIFDQLKAQGKAVVLVHHTRKLATNRQGEVQPPSMNDIRGSSAWFAAVDAIALHYRTGDAGNSRVKFRFRAAKDRDDLQLFALPQGGFTHDRKAYLQTQSKLHVPNPDRAVN